MNRVMEALPAQALHAAPALDWPPVGANQLAARLQYRTLEHNRNILALRDLPWQTD